MKKTNLCCILRNSITRRVLKDDSGEFVVFKTWKEAYEEKKQHPFKCLDIETTSDKRYRKNL